jgi:hypothetical protein
MTLARCLSDKVITADHKFEQWGTYSPVRIHVAEALFQRFDLNSRPGGLNEVSECLLRSVVDAELIPKVL